MQRSELFAIVTTIAILTIILIMMVTLTTPYLVTAQPIPSALPPSTQVPSPLTNIYKQIKNSVVQVITTETSAAVADDNSSSQASQDERLNINTGYIYDKAGHILTSAAAVEGGANTTATAIDVTFASGNTYSANITGKDLYSGLAVLEVNNRSALLTHNERIDPLPLLSNSSTLEIGQPVAIIGNPFGLSFSITSGLISGLDRLVPIPDSNISTSGAIQINGIINRGDSGPVLNMDGKVVGLMSLIYSGRNDMFTGINFAIPSNTIQKIVPQLIANGTYKHPTLGVLGTSITPRIADAMGLREARGFLVTDVASGGPAALAGIHGSSGNQSIDIGGRQIASGGDVIVGVDHRPVKKTEDLITYIEDSKSVSDTVTLKVLRNGIMKDIDVKLKERPSP